MNVKTKRDVGSEFRIFDTNFGNDDDFDNENSKDDMVNFTNTFDPEVIIAKAEGNYNVDLLEPLLVQDEDSEF